MKKEIINKIDFSDLFHYAKKYGIGWNPCNDIFFNGVLDYQSFNEFSRIELIEGYDIEEDTKFDEDLIKKMYRDNYRDSSLGYMITYNFMIDNNVESLFVDNR